MIDLHVHSNYSDGSETPETIIYKAKEMGLSAVALTDHDSIDGLEDANEAAAKLGVRFINGIELSVDNGPGRLLHILGLGLNIENEEFLESYNRYRIRREMYLGHVFEHLRGKGIHINTSEFYAFATGGRLDRQSICKWLVANGYAANITRAWIDHVDHIPYRKQELAAKEEAIEMIHAAGGKAFLAHFTKPIGLGRYSREERETFLSELKEIGLDGIERYYPTFTDEDNEEAQYYSDALGFIASGGSDFHGANRKEIELGIGEGDYEVPDDLLDDILITV